MISRTLNETIAVFHGASDRTSNMLRNFFLNQSLTIEGVGVIEPVVVVAAGGGFKLYCGTMLRKWVFSLAANFVTGHRGKFNYSKVSCDETKLNEMLICHRVLIGKKVLYFGWHFFLLHWYLRACTNFKIPMNF